MQQTYRCPHCHGRLNPNVKIILRAEHAGKRGLMLFSPQPGNYNALVPEELALTKGDVVSFSCPICARDLVSPRDSQVAEILFSNPSGREGSVVFSRIYGTHATYFITGEKVKSYGEDADPGSMNFWGVGRHR